MFTSVTVSMLLVALSTSPIMVRANRGAAVANAEAEESIEVAFVGDIIMDKSVGVQIARNGVDYPFAKTKDFLSQADLTIGNLETSVSTRGKPEKKEFTYRSKPETLKGLVNAGFDVVNLANNHTLDYGMDALFDTMQHLQKEKIGHVGAGKNEAEAFAPYIKTIKGKRVAVIGLSHVLPNRQWFAGKDKPGLAHAYSYEPMLSYVKKAVEQSDITIAVMHWNLEYKDVPEAYAREMARKLIDNGVDAIVGSHSHSIMGVEFYKNAPIYYSVGNFVFTTSYNEKGREAMMVGLTFSKEGTKSRVIPVKITNGQPAPMDTGNKQRIIDKLNRISYEAVIDQSGQVTAKKKE
ncbi:capsular polysaccharide biosynthesis protein [Brevibacillus reuszeri]|uniref:Capsular polysaccharide biosynthesis protein n=2 Tax=Brevibacillus reuszeri TaxID=54915 RepID=A0A0K9YKQ4_9BACL|nr:CapA family protein [Brevibacillus reuszeri]KNB69237.1 capsule biosynthesis protein [Brevibacillus reuszeri]MED1860177.1 CapA family protein [Brevibacillus reuszeri]GED71626.1 capsular polysaccharide biosynthesis protein [Brevibacillus reuszeri]